MLYIYENKIYVRPLENLLVEVVVTKKGNEYNVEATERKVEITNKVSDNLYSITLEKAYELQNTSKMSKKIDLD